jgi:hypothetical protein
MLIVNKTPEQIIDKAIESTGFILENRVNGILQSDGWSTISNRYYLDPNNINEAREIDLIAYKVTKRQEFSYYTAIIISCKKSERHAFTFFVRNRNNKDPNTDWLPIKTWTNVNALRFYEARNLKYDLKSHLAPNNFFNDIYGIDLQLFASQEIDLVKESAQNDKNIFGSISSLMKAQAYELESFQTRKNESCFYSIHLVTVTDCDLYLAKFSNSDKRTINKINDQKFIYNYLISKKETASIIRFTKIDTFESILKSFSKLHKIQSDYLNTKYSSFYSNIFLDKEKSSFLSKEFNENLLKVARIMGVKIENDEMKDVDFEMKKDVLLVALDMSDEKIEILKRSSYANHVVKSQLKTTYKYDGKFEIVSYDSPPF